MKKSIWILAMVLLGAATLLADAKTYKVALPDLKVGSTALPAGNYAVIVDGETVTMKDSEGNPIGVTAKVSTLEKKTNATEVHSTKVDGVSVLSEIRPGGAKVRIDFRQPTTP